MNFKILFYEVFFLIIKGYLENPKLYFCIMQVSPFAKIHKVIWKILFYFENFFLAVLL
jgi:hypothetical protein